MEQLLADKYKHFLPYLSSFTNLQRVEAKRSEVRGRDLRRLLKRRSAAS